MKSFRFCLLVTTTFPTNSLAFTNIASKQHAPPPTSSQHQNKNKSPRWTTTNLYSIPTTSWNQIESSLEPNYSEPQPTSIDSALQPNDSINYSPTKPTLFRERHGWCPYSERVWIALEAKNIPYDTIRIDNTGHGPRPSYFNGQTPQIRWPDDGSTQGESMDLVRRIDQTYPDHGPTLYPPHIQTDVINKIRAFGTIFPRRSRPSSRAAFLFRFDGEPLWKNEFETVLRDTNALLGETADGGPFFCGAEFTAADIAWAPFLERYAAQLPCLHDGLDVRGEDGVEYPNLVAWFEAMEERAPAYGCRIRGDASSWRKVLVMAGFGNAGGVPGDVGVRMESVAAGEQKEVEDEKWRGVWERYRVGRPWVMDTPGKEAAAVVVRNRRQIVGDMVKRGVNGVKEDELEDALRSMVVCLLNEGDGEGSVSKDPKVGALASFLDDRMCVPRDMGCLSAATIKRLAAQHQ